MIRKKAVSFRKMKTRSMTGIWIMMMKISIRMNRSRASGPEGRKNTGSGKSRSEKLITVISVAAALVVGIAIVYLLVNTFDKIKRDNDSLATENESTLIVDITADAVTVPDIRGYGRRVRRSRR